MTVNFTLAEPDLFGNMPVCKHLTNSVRFVQVFSKLVHIWTTRHAFYEERCMGLLYELIYLLEKETCTNISPYLDKISPACQYLEEHFTEAGSSVQLSELCGMSPAYLRRLFRLALGETPSEYKWSATNCFGQRAIIESPTVCSTGSFHVRLCRRGLLQPGISEKYRYTALTIF